MKHTQKFLLSSHLLLLTSFCFSQNLVPNPSFEDTFYCPVGFNDLPATKFWYVPNQSSPDYFNACNTSDLGVPVNAFGYQNAKTANAYTGLAVCYDTLPFCSNYREYVQIQLMSALTAGKKYVVTASIAKADSTPMVLKNIGIALSDSVINETWGNPINFTPQIIHPQFLTDTDWVEISDTIIATGGEQYLTIGNFNYNNTSDTMSLFYGSVNYNKLAYYYVDDVSVIEDTTTGINETFPENNFTIHTNNGMLFIQMGRQTKISVEIYNLTGQLIYTEHPESFTNNYSIDLSQCSNGIYLVRIKTHTGTGLSKFFLNK